ncbi:hypothetical protein A5662_15465 [Mycobacteriaceae bacterium 1482268.1]|nr:hypothetical protein A5662_15465 [Mycobacteriaceae bacterium 1482268.1]
MSRWLVTHIPSWWLLIALVVGIVGVAIGVQTLLRRRFPKVTEGKQNDVLVFGFAVVGVVYAIIMGFLISVLWGEVTHASNLAQTEGSYAIQMARYTEAFDEPVRSRLREDLLEYQRALLVEFDEVSRGGKLFTAEGALERLRATYAEIQPRDDIQRAALAGSLDSLKETTLDRTQRVLIAEEDVGPPPAIWTVIILTSTLVLAFAIFFGEAQARMHTLIVATIGVLVAGNIFLVMELAYPYLGFGTSASSLHAIDDILQQG